MMFQWKCIKLLIIYIKHMYQSYDLPMLWILLTKMFGRNCRLSVDVLNAPLSWWHTLECDCFDIFAWPNWMIGVIAATIAASYLLQCKICFWGKFILKENDGKKCNGMKAAVNSKFRWISMEINETDQA